MKKDQIKKGKNWYKCLRTTSVLFNILGTKLDPINKKERLLMCLGVLNIYNLFLKNI
jgi:hypothetical protein